VRYVQRDSVAVLAQASVVGETLQNILHYVPQYVLNYMQ
jgi:hypothetical protein